MSNEAIAEILAGIRSWVEIESQTADPDGVNQTVLLEWIADTVLVDAQPDVVDDRTLADIRLEWLAFQLFSCTSDGGWTEACPRIPQASDRTYRRVKS